MKFVIPLALTGALFCCGRAHAQVPVTDLAALARWGQQLQAMQQQYTQLQRQLRAMTNVPPNLKTIAAALLNNGIRTPLGDIRGNIDDMQHNGTSGTCANAQTYTRQNQYAQANGGDFMGQRLNATANQNAGMFACNQQMMTATQQRLDAMPALLDALQSAQDITEIEAIKARIEQENATVQAQSMQALAMGQAADMQRRVAQDQIHQKMRADAEEVMRATAPGGGVAGAVGANQIQQPLAEPPPFSAPPGG